MDQPVTGEFISRCATVSAVVAIIIVFTGVWLLVSSNELVLLLLCAEALTVLVLALLIRADARPKQRHRVK
jgi:hypothetical protein